MSTFRKVEYTMKAGVGGAGAGLAFSGLLTFLPITVSTSSAAVVSILFSVALAVYAFANID